MQLHRRSFWTALCLASTSFCTSAAGPDPLAAARAMVDAERKFYQTGQEQGTRAAFLAFLADDGIVFRPGPLNGKEVWGKRPETGFDLIWEPVFAAMSRSADFGYDTGPAKWRANKKEEKFTGHGQFISIWKKQKDGSWKVALDCGIENPEPTAKPEALRLVVPDEGQQVKSTDGRGKTLSLPETHQKFADAAKTNSAEAALGVAAEEIRVYRQGSFPAVGKNAAGALLSAKAGKASFQQLGGDMSSSGDIAYNYGKYSLNRDGGVESGHFFQIWQTDAAGVWKLVVDWQQPLPEKKP